MSAVRTQNQYIGSVPKKIEHQRGDNILEIYHYNSRPWELDGFFWSFLNFKNHKIFWLRIIKKLLFHQAYES